MRKIVLAVALALASIASAHAQEQESCAAQVGPDDAIQIVPLPGYSVLNGAAPLARPAVDGQLRAIMCRRTSLNLGPNDHRVLVDLHVPFMIAHQRRLVAIEMVDGRMQANYGEYQFTEAERAVLQAGIDRAQAAIN